MIGKFGRLLFRGGGELIIIDEEGHNIILDLNNL